MHDICRYTVYYNNNICIYKYYNRVLATFVIIYIHFITDSLYRYNLYNNFDKKLKSLQKIKKYST